MLTEIGRAGWPEAGDPPEPPPVPGFIVSTFAPLVVVAAERCLARADTPPPGTAVVIVTGRGDLGSARHVARAVATGDRVGPLMFFQSVPNAVAGHVAARHGLDGPVVCLSPPAGRAEAELLIGDGDAAAALVVVVDQEPDRAYAVLVTPEGEG